MKALMIVLAVLLVLAHPAAAAVVLVADLTLGGALGWLAWRTMRRHSYPCWRTT